MLFDMNLISILFTDGSIFNKQIPDSTEHDTITLIECLNRSSSFFVEIISPKNRAP